MDDFVQHFGLEEECFGIAKVKHDVIDISVDDDEPVVENPAPPIDKQTPSRQISDHAEIIDDLRTNGYSIVGDVLTGEECELAIDGAWKWLGELGSGIKRDIPSTWGGGNWPLGSHGSIQNYGIGHAKWVWDVRSHNNVRSYFRIYGERTISSLVSTGVPLSVLLN